MTSPTRHVPDPLRLALSAQGVFLDSLSAWFRGPKRNDGESDDDFSLRFIAHFHGLKTAIVVRGYGETDDQYLRRLHYHIMIGDTPMGAFPP